MSVTLSPPMFLQFMNPNNTGAPAAGLQLFTYIAGTSTKQATWTDSTQVTQNNNPLPLDALGGANVWGDPSLAYKFVWAPANDTDPPTSPIRTVDNLYFPLTLAALTQQVLGTLIYPRTVAEIAASVTPTNFIYPADPYVDPRRYGADPTGVSVSTTAVQKAINVALQANGLVWIGNNCNFLCGALTINFAGNQFANGLRITGSSVNGSRLTVSGTPAALLTITTSVLPSGFPFVLENFSIVGASVGAISTIAIQLTGLAQFLIRRLVIQGCAYAIQSLSCLTYTIEDCIFANNSATGSTSAVYIRGPVVTCNMVKIQRCTISGWATWAIDFDNGAELHVAECDIEQNGTNGNSNTGGIHIGGALEQSGGPALGNAKVWLENNWIEQNNGWGIKVDAPTNGSSNTITIRGGWVISPLTANQAVLVSGCNMLTMEDFMAPDAAGSVVTLTYTYGVIKNCVFSTTFTDTPVYPTYLNVQTSGSKFPNGRVDNFTATLTGCTTSPTVNVAVHQQGDEIVLDFLGSLTATSNTTAATLTGLPAKYWPIADTIGQLMIQNNGVNGVGPVQVASATGIITLNFAVGFTNAGGKGVVGGQLRFRRS